MGAFKTLGKVALGIAFPIPTATYYGVKEVKKVYDQKQQEKGYWKGKEDAASEYSVKVATLEERLQEAANRFKDYREYEEFILASFAVALSVAYCDGELSDEEEEEIKELISGVAYVRLPQVIKDEIQKLFLSPPSFNDAMELIKRVDRSEWDVFDYIINMIILSDGKERPQELAYREAWKRFKTA